MGHVAQEIVTIIDIARARHDLRDEAVQVVVAERQRLVCPVAEAGDIAIGIVADLLTVAAIGIVAALVLIRK